MAGYDEFDPRATPASSSQSYESVTVTTTASVSMEDTFAVVGKPEPSSISVLHRHEEKFQVCKEVEAVLTTTYSNGFDLDPPRWDDVKEPDLGVKEASFTISAVGELHELLKAEDKGTHVKDESQDEATQLLQWKRRNLKFLGAKKDTEKDRLSKIVAAADEQKRDFFAMRDKQLEAVKKLNREKEKSFVESREKFHSSASLNYWKAVSELIPGEPPLIQGQKKPADVNHGPKPGKPTDLTRMRQVIAKLKHRQEAADETHNQTELAATA